jgi:hypothetical protein
MKRDVLFAESFSIAFVNYRKLLYAYFSFDVGREAVILDNWPEFNNDKGDMLRCSVEIL